MNLEKQGRSVADSLSGSDAKRLPLTVELDPHRATTTSHLVILKI